MKTGRRQGSQQGSNGGLREPELGTRKNLAVFQKDFVVPSRNEHSPDSGLKHLIADAMRRYRSRNKDIGINDPVR